MMMDVQENRIPVRLGDMLYDARTYHHIHAESLYHHLCDNAAYYRIERNEVRTDGLLFCAFLGRLGISGERFHIIVSQSEAAFFHKKQLSIDAVFGKNAGDIREYLKEISDMQDINPLIRKQWEQYLKYVMIVREKGHTKEAYAAIREAAVCTMGDPDRIDFGKELLGEEEIQILLMLATEKFRQNKSDSCELHNFLDQIFSYIRNRVMDEDVRTILYSRVAAMELSCLGQGADIEHIREAAESLKNNMSIVDLVFFLRHLAEYGSVEERAKYPKQGTVLEELLQEFGDGYTYCPEELYFNRPQFTVMQEFLRMGRKEKGISQEVMSEDICAVETYSRVESGRRQPSRKNLEKMIGKLELQWGYYNGIIVTSSYKCHVARIKLTLAMLHSNYDICEKILVALENMLDMSIVQNRQYIGWQQSQIKSNKSMVSPEEAIEELWRLLELSEATLDTIRFYSPVELDILLQLGYIYRLEMKDSKKAEEIVQAVLQNEQRRQYRDHYMEMHFERLLAGLYSDFGEWKIEEKLAEKWLHSIFKARDDTQLLDQFLDLLAEALHMQKKDDSRAQRMLESAVYMAELYDRTRGARALKEAYEKLINPDKKWY